MSKYKFTTISASERLMQSMEVAIDNMIEEIKKPVDPEINGSARKAEPVSYTHLTLPTNREV